MQRVYPSLPYKLLSSNQPKNQNGHTLLSLPTELLQAVIGEMVSTFGIYQAIKLRLISKWFNELLLDVIFKGPYIKLAVLQPITQRIIPPAFLAGFLIARYEKYCHFKGSLMNIISRSALRLEDDDGVLLNYEVRVRRITALCHAVSRNLHHEEIIRSGDSSDAYYPLWDSHDENYGALIAAASTGDSLSTSEFFEKVRKGNCTSTRAEDCFGTPLTASCSSNQYHTTNLLLKSGADPNIFRTPPLYLTPLRAACSSGNSQIATLLLSPSYKLLRSDTHYETAVELAISSHHWELSQYLIELSLLPHPHALTTRLFFTAALAGNTKLLASMLDTKTIEITQECPYYIWDHLRNHSILGFAASKGHFETVQLLLGKGIPRNTPQFHNALIAACSTPCIPLAHLLLGAGCDINHILTGSHAIPHIDTPLSAACRYRRTGMVRFLLSRGADVKAGGKGDSALLLACKMGAFEIVRMLVQAGVDPDGWQSKRSRRSVPVLTALKRGHYRVVDLLLVLGARSLRPGFQEAL